MPEPTSTNLISLWVKFQNIFGNRCRYITSYWLDKRAGAQRGEGVSNPVSKPVGGRSQVTKLPCFNYII